MGIVVCICMLMGLVVLRPTPWSKNDVRKQSMVFSSFVAFSLFAVGLWNVYYGLNHIGAFWGWAGLISGVIMALAGVIVFGEQKLIKPSDSRFRLVIVALLAVFFLLYAVTLIQLNLGYAIIR